MGVPAFYRWLAEKYPKIVVDMLEKRNKVVSGQEIPLNLMDPNPNGQEFDNLYIDMNGLIHPCSHPEDREAPTTESEMYVNVTKYVDRLFAAVRPRRLLFLAIDGVAPRAKMNQQRARRFRAAQEAQERQEALNEVLDEMSALGLDGPTGGGHAWDSNVITPGTEFMDRLSVYLRFYIIDRMNRDPAWRAIKVILSDASEPGEGEHKIMKFVRTERSQPGYDPNQRHVLHGLDADLIMLGLSTHEVHFTILREEVTFGRKNQHAPMSDAKKMLHEESIGISSLRPEDEWVYSKSLQFVHIKVLREYLAFEFASLPAKLPPDFIFDIERVIDDFVFICFFVGNDFLPHLPSLDIRDGAIDFLVEAYKEMLPSMGGYLTSPGGEVNLRQVDVLLARVGEVEDEVFQRRKAAEDREVQRRLRGGHHHHKGRRVSSDVAVANEGNAILQHFRNTQQSLGAVGKDRQGGTSSSFEATASVPTTPAIPSEDKSGCSVTADKNRAAALALKNRLGTKKDTPSISDSAEKGLENTNDDGGGGECSSAGKRLRPADAESGGDVCPEHDGAAPGVSVKYQRLEECVSTGDVVDQPLLVREGDDIDNNEIVSNSGSSTGSSSSSDNEEDGDVGDIAIAVVPSRMLAGTVGTVGSAAVSGQSSLPVDIVAKLTEGGADKAVVADVVKTRLQARQQAIIEGNKGLVEDRVRFHESGWKARYYEDNFKKQDIEQGGGLSVMLREYVKGLCWVLKYYYSGCPSWNWYYPFHYAPFASDLVNVDSYDITFELSKPFMPTEQLLAVFPSDSVHAIPESCQWLMTSTKSPIRDLYSSEIPIDPNGKILPWLWVVLLPFIDEKRITNAMELCLPTMTDEEKRRNSFGMSYMFLHRTHPLFRACVENCPYEVRNRKSVALSCIVNTEVAELSGHAEKANHVGTDITCFSFNPAVEGGGVGGTLCAPVEECYFPLSVKITAPDRPLGAFRDIVHNDAACFEFRLPPELPHLSSLLPDADPGDDVLTPYDAVIRIPRLNKGMNIVDIAHRMKGGDGMFTQPNQMGFGAYHAMQDQYLRQQSQQYGEQQGFRGTAYSSNRGAGGNQGGFRNSAGGSGSSYSSEYSLRHQSFPHSSHPGGGGGGGYQDRNFPSYQRSGYISGGSSGNAGYGSTGQGGYDSQKQQTQHGYPPAMYSQRQQYGGPSAYPSSAYSLPSSSGRQDQAYGHNMYQQYEQGRSGAPQQQGRSGYGTQAPQQQHTYPPPGQYQQRQAPSYQSYQHPTHGQQQQAYSHQSRPGSNLGMQDSCGPPSRARPTPIAAAPHAQSRPGGFSFRNDMQHSTGGSRQPPPGYGFSDRGPAVGSGVGGEGSIAGLRSQLSGGNQYDVPPVSAPPQQQPFSHSRDPRIRR